MIKSPVRSPQFKSPLEANSTAVTISEMMSAATKTTLKTKDIANILNRWKVQPPKMQKTINSMFKF